MSPPRLGALPARSRRALTGGALRLAIFVAVALGPCLGGARPLALGAEMLKLLCLYGSVLAMALAAFLRERPMADELNLWDEGLALLAMALLARALLPALA